MGNEHRFICARAFMLTKWFLHVGRVTVQIDNDHARTGNQMIEDHDFLDEILGFLNEKVQE